MALPQARDFVRRHDRPFRGVAAGSWPGNSSSAAWPCSSVLESRDGSVKYLFRLGDGSVVETVYIPEADRVTLCLSTQVGCGLGCVFCATARMGLKRNLTQAEIV